MLKGASLIITLVTIGIAVALAAAFYDWGGDVSETFEGAMEEKTGSAVEGTKTTLAIVDVYDDKIVIKNKGKNVIDSIDLSFYINRTKYDPTSGPASIGSADTGTFQLPVNLDYSLVKVTGPSGSSDEINTSICGSDRKGQKHYGVCWYLGGVGENCDIVCTNHGTYCYNPDWSPVPENCNIHLSFGLTCSSCNVWNDPPSPGEYEPPGPMDCFYRPIGAGAIFRCDVSGVSLRRICPCAF